jgi:hypothetical protein
MRSKKTAATDVNRLVSSASTLLTEIVDENEAFVTSIVNVEQFVQAIFDILLPDIVFAEDYSVVLRLAADKGGSTTKVIFSFLLSERANSPFAFYPLAIYDGMYLFLSLQKFNAGNDGEEEMRIAAGDVMQRFAAIATVRGRERDHRVKLIFNGDYMAISAVIGHGGPASSFPCFHCEVPLNSLRAGEDEGHRLRRIEDVFADAKKCQGTSFFNH